MSFFIPYTLSDQTPELELKTTAIVLSVLAALCCCAGVLLLSMFSLGIIAARSNGGPVIQLPVLPTYDNDPDNQPSFNPETPVPVKDESAESGYETIESILEAQIPEADQAELVVRLGGVTGPIPDTVPARAVPYAVGDRETFWASNTDTNESFRVEASLVYLTDHSYFWVETGVRLDEEELKRLADDFEYHIYPTVRAFFGSEWSPGIDNDPRIYLLFARGLGRDIAGYFSSADELHPLAHEYSNAREMFFISVENNRLEDVYTYGLLAHEFQHMIHWHGDRNEDIWVNEGFSELATLITGYYDGGFDYDYARQPDIPLFVWPENGDPVPHYGGAFLYLAYFYDRFGTDLTRALVAHPDNGLAAIDSLLAEAGLVDPQRGRPGTGIDVFQDFAAALYLLDDSVGDGRYKLAAHPDTPRTSPTERIASCPTGDLPRDVNQFGIDYIRITCRGSFNLTFTGSTAVDLLPTDPYSADYVFWSNRADEADIMLTRKFDFSDHTGPLTLSYHTWFDIEADFDYAYLVASTDGENWKILKTPGGTGSDPTGNNFGWAYNGRSRGWLHETVDLSRFAGEEVWLRFEYVTDGAVNAEGLLLDDIAIPETGYFSDFETDDGGWDAAGFVRIRNVVPQTYRLTLITYGETGISVTYLDLDGSNRLTVPIEIGGSVDELVLVVSGTNPFSRQKAGYILEVSP